MAEYTMPSAASQEDIATLNGNITPAYEALETGMTIVRMGKLRILTLFGVNAFNDSSYSISAGDLPSYVVSASCFITDTNYRNVRIGRLFFENGTFYIRQCPTYADANVGLSKISTGDRVYGEIVYTV